MKYRSMSPAKRFLIVLVVGLGLLTVGASFVANNTTRTWFEKDLDLRASLVLSGARQALIRHWNQGPRLEQLLTDITRDERILSAAACGADLQLVARTETFPPQFGCAGIGGHLRPAADASAAQWTAWKTNATVRGGDVQVTALPVTQDQDHPLGFVVLVHDLTFVARREASTRYFLLVAFGVLALGAAGLTILAVRFSWRGWSNELRKLLQGGGPRPQFQPMLQDVRELVERIAAEKDDGGGGHWTPERLKETLHQHLHGEKVVILANRQPYIHTRAADGSVITLHPASGLVTALEPVMRACSGTWVAHGNGSADRETADPGSRIRVPPGEESYQIRRVWLTPEEERGYYYGFANEGLWPLCHVAHNRPVFRGEDWAHYQAVNRKFAEAVCEEVDSADPIILVQDYHFALAPKLIRERLPRATVILFWHTPWPTAQRFGICPWRDDLLEGMLGSSIVAFHTQSHCNNFTDCVDRFMEARIDREQNAIVHHKRSSLVRAYPISIEWPNHWAKACPSAAECRASVFAELKLAPNALLGVGVDRLDYTKGVEERLLAVEQLLEKCPEFRGRFTFVQLAAPSRLEIDRYRQLNEAVEQVAARINQRFGTGAYRPIVLLRTHHEPPTVFKYYRAADVCYVSSLHDGMNLIAKEFVAAREDDRGVLVLSQFTGAARELTEALVVNPYDLDEASAALATALHMSPDEQRDRMHAMRRFVSEFNVYRWAGRMLVDAARLRRRDRLTGRLSEHGTSEAGRPIAAPAVSPVP